MGVSGSATIKYGVQIKKETQKGSKEVTVCIRRNIACFFQSLVILFVQLDINQFSIKVNDFNDCHSYQFQ